MLTHKTYEQFRTLIYQESGIALNDKKMALVSARVNKRLRALDLSTYEEYLSMLQQDTNCSEMVHFLNAISTNTTHFFREPDHFDFFMDTLSEWQSKGQTKFRIWCAASSSGEEPYTIAMTMREVLSNSNVQNSKILATDISTDILTEASQGTYSANKVEAIPKHLVQKYFHHERHDCYTVEPSLRKMVTFKRLNLSIPPFPMKGPFDIVFCRNVMIYFDSRVREKLVADAYRLLKPDGYLIVGHSESLNNLSHSFKNISPSIYKK